MSTQREVRYLEATEVRAKGGSSDADPLRLEGYAAVFNRTAKLPKFREQVKPGAFTRAIRDGQDVVCLFNHNSNIPLGRTSAGTLRLSQDDRGLHYEVDLPNTQGGRDTHESVKRGDINGCSFAFTVPDGGQEWSEQEENGVYYVMRSLTDLNLHDVSPVTYPTYAGTEVYARSEEMADAPVELRSAVEAKNNERGMMDMKAIDVPAKKEQPYDPTDNTPEKAPVSETRPYAKPGDVPENVPAAHKAQFMEVFNSAHAAAKKDGKSDKDADASAFAQAWGVINKARSDAGEAEIRWEGGMSGEATAQSLLAAEAKTETQDEDQLEEGFDRAMNDEDQYPTLDPFGLSPNHVDGDCEDEQCACQNRMYGWGARAALLPEEFRAGTRTKRVGGKDLTAKSFAFVGDPNRTETWKYPIHDANHVRNALARWGQHKGIPSDKEAGVLRKIHAAAKKFGIDVSDERSWNPADVPAAVPEPWHPAYKAVAAGAIPASAALRFAADQPRNKGAFGSTDAERASSMSEHNYAVRAHMGKANAAMDAENHSAAMSHLRAAYAHAMAARSHKENSDGRLVDSSKAQGYSKEANRSY